MAARALSTPRSDAWWRHTSSAWAINGELALTGTWRRAAHTYLKHGRGSKRGQVQRRQLGTTMRHVAGIVDRAKLLEELHATRHLRAVGLVVREEYARVVARHCLHLQKQPRYGHTVCGWLVLDREPVQVLRHAPHHPTHAGK